MPSGGIDQHLYLHKMFLWCTVLPPPDFKPHPLFPSDRQRYCGSSGLFSSQTPTPPVSDCTPLTPLRLPCPTSFSFSVCLYVSTLLTCLSSACLMNPPKKMQHLGDFFYYIIYKNIHCNSFFFSYRLLHCVGLAPIISSSLYIDNSSILF